MHVVVLLKQVYEPNTPPAYLSIGVDGNSLALQCGTRMVMNAYDANAVEEAIRIKERAGALVTVISVGDQGSISHIRRALAMGADHGIHVEGPTGIDCDPRQIATLACAAIARLEPVDIVMCGRQASDTDAGQVPFHVARILGFGSISPVVALPVVGDTTLEVHRIGERGTQHIRARLPVVLGISNEINKPRSPGLKGVMAAKKAEVPSWGAADLGISLPQQLMERAALAVTPRKSLEAEILKATNAAEAGRMLADRLKAEGYC